MLTGCFEPTNNLPPYVSEFISELKMPQAVKDLGQLSMERYSERKGEKNKEKISCYPYSLSFSTMKAGATNDTIDQLECQLTRITIMSGYSPK